MTAPPSTLLEANRISCEPRMSFSIVFWIDARSLSVSGLTPRLPSRTTSERGSAVSSSAPPSSLAAHFVTSMIRSWPTLAATPSR